METAAPSPYSPYATADPTTRHLFPLLFGPPPTAGTLLPTGCNGLAVVPDEPLEVDPAAEDLPAGLCTGCVAAMRGLEVPDHRPLAECRNCAAPTRHNRLCAGCSNNAHQLWVETRTAPGPPLVHLPTVPFVALGGDLRVTPDAFCEHGDLAFAVRLKGHHLIGDQHEEELPVVFPRCYLAKIIGGVLAVVDHDPNPEAQDRFTTTVNRTQDKVRAALKQRDASRGQDGASS